MHVLAPHPGRIVSTIDVDLDKSDLNQLRLSAAFMAKRRTLSGILRQLEPALV